MMQEMSLPMVNLTPLFMQPVGGAAPGAATQAPGGTTGVPGGTTGASGGSNIFFFAIIMMVGMFLIMSMSGRKEKKRRAQMLSTLNKRDKVRSAGGIIGTIVEIKENEILIETDKSSHTRLWLSKGSVSTVLDSVGSNQNDQNEQEISSS